VDPNSHEQIAEAIYKVLTNEDLASKLKYAGIKQAAKFTWKNTAQQTLEVYKNVAKG
jgi:glycosyltransferase involved in cell wall biosynthesis